jgi:GR25 family glycosyltransferase involved in LPS biosynthesis
VKINPAHIPFHLFHSGWTQLAVTLQRAFCMVDPKPVRLRALEFLRQGARLRAMHWPGEQDYPVYVINRSKDTERMSRFAESCRNWGISYERVDGVDLRQKPEFMESFRSRIAELCYNKTDFVRGIYGCFLGHREAWQLVANGSSDWALICEDDARFLGPIPKNIKQFELPKNSEIIFCNQRMADGLLSQSASHKKLGFDFLTVDDALKYLLDFTPIIVAPGGDSYLLSKIAAHKLLVIFEEMQMSFDVDWFMLFHCINNETMRLFLQTDQTGRFDGYIPHKFRLSGFVLQPSLVDQTEGESKVRRMEFCSREELFLQ